MFFLHNSFIDILNSLPNFVYNIRFYSKHGKEYESLQKANQFLKNKKLNEIKDLIKIERFFIDVINNRKDNLVHCFVPHSEVKSKDYDYYMHQLDWVLNDYYKTEKGCEICKKDKNML